MLQVGDSITTYNFAEEPGVQVVQHRSKPTPAQILKWLPKNATPEQQDSAIQANIKVSEIHWSQQPDTLHLPGHTAGKSIRDVSLPQYYKESFFVGSEFYHPEQPGGRVGVAGDPVPYSISSDNLITSMLLGCFVIALVALSGTRTVIIQQLKDFFRKPSFTSISSETSVELRFQVFLILQTCLLLAILYFGYIHVSFTDTYVIEPYQVMTIFSGFFATYFIMKLLLYIPIGWVFFEKKQNNTWRLSYIYIVALEGVALFPLVLLQSYFNLSLNNAILYTTIVVVIFKILTFYKQKLIFFPQKGTILQLILYFCALEIIPLFAILGTLKMISNYLKINF